MNEFLLFLGIILNYILIFRVDKYLNTSFIFKLFLLFSLTNWYVIPIIASMFGYYEFYEYLIDVPLSKYYYYAIFEVWFFTIILFLFYLSSKYKFKRKIELTIIDNPNASKYLNPFFILYTIIYLLYCFVYRMDYLEVNQVENPEGGIFFIFNAIGLYIFSYYWIKIIKKDSKIFVFSLLLIAYIIYNIISGSRIFLIALIWMFYFFNKEKFKSLKYITITIALFVFSLIMLPVLANIRVGDDNSGITFDKDVVNVVIEQLNIKSNAIGYSSVLIENDGIGYAGINPYIGSFFKFLPRTLWAGKPTPTSFNGDITGTPARRVAFLLSGQDGTYNVGVSPGLVCLWHGYFSVILSVVINVLFLSLLAFLLSLGSVYMNSLGFLLFYFPQLIMTPSYGDNIIQKVFEVLLLFCLLFFFRVIKITTKELI